MQESHVCNLADHISKGRTVFIWEEVELHLEYHLHLEGPQFSWSSSSSLSSFVSSIFLASFESMKLYFIFVFRMREDIDLAMKQIWMKQLFG